jgi:hypothetical protein
VRIECGATVTRGPRTREPAQLGPDGTLPEGTRVPRLRPVQGATGGPRDGAPGDAPVPDSSSRTTLTWRSTGPVDSRILVPPHTREQGNKNRKREVNVRRPVTNSRSEDFAWFPQVLRQPGTRIRTRPSALWKLLAERRQGGPCRGPRKEVWTSARSAVTSCARYGEAAARGAPLLILDVVDDSGLLRALERRAPHCAPRAHMGNAVTRL